MILFRGKVSNWYRDKQSSYWSCIRIIDGKYYVYGDTKRSVHDTLVEALKNL